MSYYKFKSSAIHNLIITHKNLSSKDNEYSEGLVIPKSIMNIADIKNGEEIIITKIGGENWKNRIKTFAIEGEEGKVELRGSICNFLDVGDITCIISEMYLDAEQLKKYNNNEIPIFDLGFDPKTNKDNSYYHLDIQYLDKKIKDVKKDDGVFIEARIIRQDILKVFLKSLVTNLIITNTHPDCLQGSAEIPKSILNAAQINQYKSVSVYNVTKGGVADTYAVSMPEGIVMTTGAMASFAKIGEKVNVVSYILSKKSQDINFVNAVEYIKK